jgi:hypothetical protein
MISSHMAVCQCEEHSRLTLAVVDARAKLPAFHDALDEAKRTSVDLVPPMALLQAAKSEQRHAVAALTEHEKLHGCVPMAGSNPAVSIDYDAIRADAQQALIDFLQASLKAGFIFMQSALIVKNEGRTDHFFEAEQNALKAAEPVKTFSSLVNDRKVRAEIESQLTELERLICTL